MDLMVRPDSAAAATTAPASKASKASSSSSNAAAGAETTISGVDAVMGNGEGDIAVSEIEWLSS